MGKVFVTGIGIVSAIGLNSDENLKSLRLAQSGIEKTHFFQSKYADDFCFGEVGLSTNELLQQCHLEKTKGLTRTDALAFKAFNEAINDAKLSQQEISTKDTAFISASTVGGMCAHNELFTDAQLPEKPSDFLFSYQYASHALSIIDRYKIKGITNTINTACSSSANAIMMGVKLIQSRRVKRAIVGGVDSLSKYTVNGFNALRILSDTPCRPFDENRKGLSLGEGAAYLVLEAEEYVSGKKLYAAVSGFGNANDTFHQSSLSDDAQGVISAMKKAILNAGLSSDDIHYINAHGTGTENNDRVELLGITKIFNSVPPYNSTKSYTGHTLGAAGSMEAVFCIMSLCHNELYKSLNCNEPLLAFNCPPIKDYKQNVFIEHVLSNSFGFGGNCASVIFSKT